MIIIKVLFIKILIEQVKSKGIYLKLKASGRLRLKNCVWSNGSEEVLLKTRHQKQGHQKQGHQKQWSSEAYLVRSYFTRVDKEQCTKCTTTNSALVSATNISATCFHIKTRIITILLQTLFLLKRNGFEISSS